MKHNCVVVVCVLSVFLSACEVTCRRYRSYIDGYVCIDTLWVETENIKYNGVSVHVQTSHLVHLDSSGDDKCVYDSLCSVHNDMSYNTTETRPFLGGGPDRLCFYPDLKGIDIVCLQQYDDTHPSNASLGDVVRFMAISPKKFVDDNYSRSIWRKVRRENNISPEWLGLYGGNDSLMAVWCGHYYFYPVDALLVDLTDNQLMLLGATSYSLADESASLGLLLFTKEPFRAGTYDFNLTCTDIHGKQYTTTFSKTWE